MVNVTDHRDGDCHQFYFTSISIEASAFGNLHSYPMFFVSDWKPNRGSRANISMSLSRFQIRIHIDAVKKKFGAPYGSLFI